MSRYESIREQIRRNPSLYQLEPCSEKEIARERIEGVPEDYIDFLREIGYGHGGYFHFYGGLVEVDEIYDACYDEDEHADLQQVLLFGDNGSGDAVGFLTTDGWALVEIWHDDNLSLHYREEQSFEEFVRRLFVPNQ
ncbi:hypothetical protein ABD76_12040 [Paenibacillus dendritiformis]|uniref:SMI1/KNR4 family protein n=1 Tax=Paenibacillus dendritiformis TaxID=130049 RepID=UPI0018CE719C|nr:SMI1/KNR4 family protein [Paenibacillus dendritiformis]MBG9793188.1 hypothetical protein [Paenibacillus dendritiformis]